MTAPDPADALAAAVAALRAGGRDKIADELERPGLDRSNHIPSILVAGEDKRGKSSLVNALIGAADLSPVGVEVNHGLSDLLLLLGTSQGHGCSIRRIGTREC